MTGPGQPAPSPGQAAHEARRASFWRRHGEHSKAAELPEHDRWERLSSGERADEEAGAQAVLDRAFPGLRARLAKARAEAARVAPERDQARKFGDAAERIITSLVRSIYAAHIDTVHGDPNDASAILLEALDGYDGPQWNGTETGIEWLERTKAEEVAGASPAAAFGANPGDNLVTGLEHALASPNADAQDRQP